MCAGAAQLTVALALPTAPTVALTDCGALGVGAVKVIWAEPAGDTPTALMACTLNV